MSKPLKPWFYFFTAAQPADGTVCWVKQTQSSPPFQMTFVLADQAWSWSYTLPGIPDPMTMEFSVAQFPWWRAL